MKMNDEKDYCWVINPPEGCEFLDCTSCGNAYIHDLGDPVTVCAWCDINRMDE